MIKRSEYMEHKVTHDEYYGQFVTSAVTNVVKTLIGESAIKASTDQHLNDIPLNRWDNLHEQIGSICGKKLKEANESDGWSLSDTVCIAKACARQIRGSLPEPN